MVAEYSGAPTYLVHYDHSAVEELCRELIPGIKVINLVDDSLLAELFEAGRVTEHIIKRVCLQVLAAEDAGADVILSVCNSVPEAIETAGRLASVPVVAIGEAMAEELVRTAERIGVGVTGWPSASRSSARSSGKPLARARPSACAP